MNFRIRSVINVLRVLGLACIVVLTLSCGGGGAFSGNGISSTTVVDPITFPLPPKTPVAGPNATGKVNGTINMQGAILNLPSVASVTFSSGSLPTNQLVSLRATSDADTATSFDVQGSISEVAVRQPYEIRINTGSVWPDSGATSVTLNLPAAFVTAAPAGASFVVFGQEDIGGDDETLIEFTPLDSTYNATAGTISLTLADSSFTNSTADGSYEAVLIVAIIPMSSSKSLSRVVGPTIQGLGAPLDTSLYETSPYGIRTLTIKGKKKTKLHAGIDLRAAYNAKTQIGQYVLAAADGIIQNIYGDAKGYGNHFIIRHYDGSATLYAHLHSSLFSNSTAVVKGQIIAISGNSGIAAVTGPHLHFEFIPIFPARSGSSTGPPPAHKGPYRADPFTLIQLLTNTIPTSPISLTIGQMSNIQAMSAAGTSWTTDSNAKQITNINTSASPINQDSNGNPTSLPYLSWTTSDNSIASVDNQGGVTGVAPGTATITLKQTSGIVFAPNSTSPSNPPIMQQITINVSAQVPEASYGVEVDSPSGINSTAYLDNFSYLPPDSPIGAPYFGTSGPLVDWDYHYLDSRLPTDGGTSVWFKVAYTPDPAITVLDFGKQYTMYIVPKYSGAYSGYKIPGSPPSQIQVEIDQIPDTTDVTVTVTGAPSWMTPPSNRYRIIETKASGVKRLRRKPLTASL